VERQLRIAQLKSALEDEKEVTSWMESQAEYFVAVDGAVYVVDALDRSHFLETKFRRFEP